MPISLCEILRMLIIVSTILTLGAGLRIPVKIKEKGRESMSLMCFGFMTSSASDVRLFPEVATELSGCDDWRYFTPRDKAAIQHPNVQEIDLVNVHPNSKQNMIGVIPAWKYLLHQYWNFDRHDWALQVELDHYVRPRHVKLLITNYLQSLTNQNKSTDVPLLFAFGNAFAFNRKAWQQMREQWANIDVQLPKDDDVAPGCPDWGCYSNYPQCAQDTLYPIMSRTRLKPPLSLVGKGACNHELGASFRLACWQEERHGLNNEQFMELIKLIKKNDGDKSKMQITHVSNLTKTSAPTFMKNLNHSDEKWSNMEAYSTFLGSPELSKMMDCDHTHDHIALTTQRESLRHYIRRTDDLVRYPDKDIPIIHNVKSVRYHQLLQQHLP